MSTDPEELSLSADAASASPAARWRHVSEAPRDGKQRLFWSPLGGCFIAPDNAPVEPTREERLKSHLHGGDWPNVGWNATHWMDLPQGPDGASSASTPGVQK